MNHIQCHFAAHCRFDSETSIPKRVRFPAAPPLGGQATVGAFESHTAVTLSDSSASNEVLDRY